MRYLILILFVLSLATGAKYAFDLYHKVHDRKEMMEDYAEINKANYELFNIQLWKDQALDIITNRIKEFKISNTMYGALDTEIQSYLKIMYKRYFTSGELSNIILEEVRKGGKVNKLFMGILEKQVPDMIKQLDLRDEIPGLSNQLIKEIKTNEPVIRSYMQQELLRLVLDNASQDYIDRREVIYAKYDLSDLSETDTYLNQEVANHDAEIKSSILVLIGILAFAILLALVLGKVMDFAAMVAGLTMTSIILLVLGVSMPMIDIDARLNSFVFEFLEEEVAFDEQIIYYQSKSIVEVTKTLWQGGSWDLKLVGMLVLLFSIVFPFIKLILSGLFLWVDKVKNSSLAKGIIFHLGKWSMADVFVVAIFMAYIGFYGIISAQLNGISQNQGGFAIETVNYSRLSPGAFFFTAYTLLSICISILINRSAKKEAE